jgi:hypothetical protein
VQESSATLRVAAERAIDAAPTHSLRGRVWRTHWRQVAATDWSRTLRTTGRYHRGLDQFAAQQVWPALYTSLAPETAIWEMVRRSVVRNIAYLRNNVLSELEVDLSNVLDLADPAVVALAPAELTGSDLRLCHELAATSHALGFEALVVPSAALLGSNLVLFPRNLPEPSPIRLVRSTELPLDLDT